MLVESHGPLGILWVGIALGAFYIALIWLNTLLGFFLTPLFVIPQTWLMDLAARKLNIGNSSAKTQPRAIIDSLGHHRAE